MQKHVIAGIDIGGTKTAVVLSAVPPQILVRDAFPTKPQNGPEQTIETIVASLHRGLISSKIRPDQLAAIGVSCGGPLDSERGVIQSPPNLTTWVDVPDLQHSRDGIWCSVLPLE